MRNSLARKLSFCCRFAQLSSRLQQAASLFPHIIKVRGQHETRETRAAAPALRLESRARSFSSLARFARRVTD